MRAVATATIAIGRRIMLRIAWWTLLYRVSAIDVNSAVPKMLSYAEHQSASRTLAESYEWFEQMLKSHIAPRAVEQIDLHRRQDHRVVLISASTQFAVQPVADYLHVDFLCTRLIDRDDELTGQVVDPPCYGAGKVVWAQRYAADRPEVVREGINLSVPAALSALVSKYLDAVVAADQAEVAGFFGHFVARSKVHDAVNALLAARELNFVPVGNSSKIQVTPRPAAQPRSRREPIYRRR